MFTVASYHFIYRSSKLEIEKSVIIGLIKDFINPAVDRLQIESKLCGFEFPNGLDYSSGIIFKDDVYRRFLKRRFLWVIKWEIKKYVKYYNIINKKVIKLAEKAEKKRLIGEIYKVYGHSQTLLLKDMLMSGNKDLDNLLLEYGLIDDIKEIEELTEKLPFKAKKLAKKLENLRYKWKERYNIV